MDYELRPLHSGTTAGADYKQHSQDGLDRSRLLLEINNAVVSLLDLESLLKVIFDRVRQVFQQTTTATLSIYDPESDRLRYHLLHSMQPETYQEGTPVDLEGTPSGLAFTSRQIVLIHRVRLEDFPAPFVESAYANGVRSGCSVPLMSRGRAVGTITVGAESERAYSEADAELLAQVAQQIAMPVENALNFQRAERERERSRLLLEINNAVVSHLDLKKLVETISASLRNIMPHDAAGIALYEPEHNHLREYSNVNYGKLDVFHEGDTIPLEGTPAGEVFVTGKPMLIRRPNPAKYTADRYSRNPSEGSPKSACLAPLVSHGRNLGIAGVSSTQEDRFSDADLELFTQITGQIAIAVENALNFERARAAEQEVRRKLERERLMLEINNAVVSHLDLRHLVKIISTSLRKVLRPDVTGISLYDAETNQFSAYFFDLPDNLPPIEEGTRMPLEGSVGGLAFVSGRPVFMSRPDPEMPSNEFDRRLIEGGIRSGGVVPLIAHERKLGFLGVGSFREDAFSEDDQELLCHIANQIAIAVENALQYGEIESLKNKLASEKLYLEEEIKTEYNFAEIVGRSDVLKKVLRQVETVAPTDSCVLLCGETGTGKELIARAIHSLSTRRERTLVKLNCAAIPTGLLESELFGHEKGAFTGAIAQRVGRFELAHKGTLLLDEVGEIPLELQPKLLRVLQEHEFERLGSSRTIKTDVRLVAATNCDLPRMVAEKKFRGDLFYRLNVFPVRLPPLRERADDIPLLASYFTQKHSLRMNKRIETISKETVDALSRYPWPGNVRELENFIERAVILTSGAELQVPLGELRAPADFTPAAATSSASASRLLSLEEVERAHIEDVLRETRGAIAGRGGAAEILGLPASTLRSRMKKLGLK